MTFILIEILSFFGWYNLLTQYGKREVVFHTCTLKSANPISERLLQAFVLTVWQITLVCILTAWCGVFDWWACFMWNLPVLVCLPIGCMKKSRDIIRVNWNEFRSRLHDLWDSPTVTYLILLTILVVGVVLWYGLRLPMMQYDVYHVIRGAMMIQTGHLSPFEWDGLGVDYYPGNADILFAWRLLGSHNDAFLPSVQLTFGIAGCVAIYRLLKEVVSASRETSVIVALCLWSMTTVMHLAWVSMNDLMVACMVWVAWSFAGSKRLTWWNIVFAGLAGGWAVGGKSSVGMWVMGMAAYTIWRIWNERKT